MKTSVTVLVTPSREIDGQWIAHCLDFDIVTQGNSLTHAFEMAREAIFMCIQDDLNNGFDPLCRGVAPQEYWSEALRLDHYGPLMDSDQIKSACGAFPIRIGNMVEVNFPHEFMMELTNT